MTDVIVLGLDGATWDVLRPFMDNKRMPNLERLIEDSYHGTLKSTFPPITAPAWLSMATGQNPGKTGVFYFLNRTSTTDFDLKPMGAKDFHGQSFWDILDENDTSTGILNFPMLYPPYKIDGFMVSGFGAPEDKTLTTPASLQTELHEVTGGYEVKVPYADPKYTGRPDDLKQDLLRVLKKREAAIEHLLTEKRPDVFFGVVSVTDWAQHYFWRYHDSEHVLHEPGYENALADIFSRVDETIGKVANIASAEDATLLLTSDHGFGPVNGTLYSNEWLEQEELRIPQGLSLFSKFRSEYFPYLRQVVEPVVSLVPMLNDLAVSLGRSVRASPLDTIDREKSIAFASEQGFTTGLIYMLSDDPEDRKRVVFNLQSICDEHGLTVDIYAPDDLYHGPNVDLAPDILFEVEGLEYAVDPRYSMDEGPVIKKPPSVARSGGHRQGGIYLMTGPNIEPGTGKERPLLDVAPTILALQSLPIPEEMDGSPMYEAFDTIETVGRAPLADLIGASTTTDRQDVDEVRDRLEDLGYL